MQARPDFDPSDKVKFYEGLAQATAALMDSEWISNLANLSALLRHEMPNLNWAGFYLLKDDLLILGPFQGQPACLRIPLGKGVCGTSALTRKTLVVADVDLYPGHIACDSASRSEIVVPLIKGERLYGVMDLDAPILGRFDEQDRIGLERIAAILLEKTEFPESF